MLRCNLNDILWSKHLRITQVHRETGISRPTLTALYNDRSSGIRLDTMDKLCQYLAISPSELFTHIEDVVPRIVGR